MTSRRFDGIGLFERLHDAAADYLDASQTNGSLVEDLDRTRLRFELELEAFGDLLARTPPAPNPTARAIAWLRYKLRPRADLALLATAISFFQLAGWALIETQFGITMGLSATAAAWILGTDD